ncbi:MAG: hypothetical protein KatS3mg126_1691 [Lysobacteraceae bacterium]|nr:MAG: hypothetical protein KatS3mg126_1691 [Xanthomonadaceae bacterium]
MHPPVEGSGLEAFLRRYEQRDRLRFITCGSVDDGKSTLIGRLLHDSRQLREDQLQTLVQESRRIGTQQGELDFALLVDGLEAEREQGITIDVAYRFFATERRSFIVADCPGHEQYTRNMATGASTADLAVLLVDARKGLLTQTRRHAYICALFGVRQMVLAVNKMDAVAYAREVFEPLHEQFLELARRLGLDEVHALPISALRGDNVTQRSERMDWYGGPSLLELLETLPLPPAGGKRFCMPVQWVNRPDQDFRGLAGTDRRGLGPHRRCGGGAALGAALAHRPDRDRRRRPRACRGRAGRHPGARGRPRRQPGRCAGGRWGPSGGGRSVRRAPAVDGPRAAAPRVAATGCASAARRSRPRSRRSSTGSTCIPRSGSRPASWS